MRKYSRKATAARSKAGQGNGVAKATIPQRFKGQWRGGHVGAP